MRKGDGIEWPMTHHPYFEGTGIPERVRRLESPAVHYLSEEPRSFLEPSPTDLLSKETLVVRKCAAPAPYVGDHFWYEWYVWRDGQGRWIAGPTWIQRDPLGWMK
jgi:hypothetical protein